MKDQDVAIDPAEILGVLLKALDGLAAGLIDTRTANGISKAAKRANSLMRASLKGAMDDQRSEFAAIVAELRDADRMLAGLLARKLDATIAAYDLNASNEELGGGI
jgi:hypothetical protein